MFPPFMSSPEITDWDFTCVGLMMSLQDGVLDAPWYCCIVHTYMYIVSILYLHIYVMLQRCGTYSSDDGVVVLLIFNPVHITVDWNYFAPKNICENS